MRLKGLAEIYTIHSVGIGAKQVPAAGGRCLASPSQAGATSKQDGQTFLSRSPGRIFKETEILNIKENTYVGL